MKQNIDSKHKNGKIINDASLFPQYKGNYTTKKEQLYSGMRN
jgi:hypothetical protein